MYRKHDFSALIAVDARRARRELLATYERVSCSWEAFAAELGCGVSTAYRWVHQLERKSPGVLGAMRRMRHVAKATGRYRGPGRQRLKGAAA